MNLDLKKEMLIKNCKQRKKWSDDIILNYEKYYFFFYLKYILI